MAAIRRAPLTAQLLRFCLIGGCSTAAYLLLYTVFDDVMPALAANLVALGITAVANSETNRRITFRLPGTTGLMRAQLGGVTGFLLALAVTSGALTALHAANPHASEELEIGVLLMANIIATGLRFMVLRAWISGAHQHHVAPEMVLR